MRTRVNSEDKAGFREGSELRDCREGRGGGEKREEPRVVEVNGAGTRVPEEMG